MPNHAPPKYRQKTVGNSQYAVVTLRDRATGERRDFVLGEYGSPASRERYAALIAEWEHAGRRLPRGAADRRVTVAHVASPYDDYAAARFSRPHYYNVRAALRVLLSMYASTAVTDFGPRSLRSVRDAMLAGDKEIKRSAWNAASANKGVHLIVSMFRWAVSEELVDESVYRALQTLAPLREGQKPTVRPAQMEAVHAVLPLVSDQVATMIRVQLLTGMRPGEVCAMRACDLDMGAAEWIYRPRHHKAAHLERDREIWLGPRARKLIRPYLKRRGIAAPLFSPREAEADRRAAQHASRKTPENQGNRPALHLVDDPQWAPGEAYDVASYRRAIRRACTKAGVERWHPHQLRHNYATEIRRLYGLEAAQIMLGHSSALVTDAVYAERDQAKAREVAKKLG